MQKAVDTLRQACPNTVPQTPVGRLDVMQKRLEAMIDAANTVRPALEEFYTSLERRAEGQAQPARPRHRPGRLTLPSRF